MTENIHLPSVNGVRFFVLDRRKEQKKRSNIRSDHIQLEPKIELGCILDTFSTEKLLLEALNKMVNLPIIHFDAHEACNVTGECLEIVKTWTNLKSLNLTDNWRMRGVDLSHIGNLTNLEELFFSSDNICDESFVHFNNMSHLTCFHCIWSQKIDGSGLTHLAQSSSTLTELSLHGCRYVTDTGLECLSDFKQLEKMDLSYCVKLTDKVFEVFTNLSELKEVILHETTVSKEGIKQFQKKLPSVKLFF